MYTSEFGMNIIVEFNRSNCMFYIHNIYKLLLINNSFNRMNEQIF